MSALYPAMLRRGIALHIHELELGPIYKPVGAYAATDFGIYTGMTKPTADNVISLYTRPFSRNAGSAATGLTPVQIFIRRKGTNAAVEELAEELRISLETRGVLVLGELRARAVFASATELGQDSSGRAEYSLNMNFVGRRPIKKAPQVGASTEIN